jgi:hypothetical protein
MYGSCDHTASDAGTCQHVDVVSQSVTGMSKHVKTCHEHVTKMSHRVTDVSRTCHENVTLTVTVTVNKPPKRQPTPNAVGPALGLRQTTGVGLIMSHHVVGLASCRITSWPGSAVAPPPMLCSRLQKKRLSLLDLYPLRRAPTRRTGRVREPVRTHRRPRAGVSATVH